MQIDGDLAGRSLAEMFSARGDIKGVARRARLHREGDLVTHAVLVTGGWIGRFRSGRTGAEAFTGLYVVGDAIGLDALAGAAPYDELVALTDATVLRIPLARLQDEVADGGPVALEIAHRLIADARFLREALVAVGTQSSRQKVSCFMLQTFDRLRATGLIAADLTRFPLPLTQANLGAITGLTSVHVNRVLKRLRTEGLLEMRGGIVRILDLPGLRAAAVVD